MSGKAKRSKKRKGLSWASRTYNEYKHAGVLDDRSEYGLGDLSSANPDAKDSDLKQLYKMLRQYRH